MLTKLQNLRQKNSNKRSSEKGFTIIEVMIVLAIAGLILLIVFLAVPALQRNSRNTQRKSDVATLLQEYSNELGNSNGTLPATCTGAVGTCWVRDAKLGHYENGTSKVEWTLQAAAAAATNVSDTDSVKFVNYLRCTGASTSTAATNITSTTGAIKRSVVALYATEGQGKTTYVCQET